MITSTHNAPTGKRQLLLERVPAGRFHFMKDKLFEMLGGMTSVSIKPGEVWYDYLHQMVLRHPDAADKIGAGVAAFIVRRKTRMGNTYPELFVERIDGTTIDVSWRKCEKGMDHSTGQLFTMAMRQAIAPQIASFRSTVKVSDPCGFCGVAVGVMMHIDHARPFADLLRTFMQGRVMPDPRNIDETFIAEWQAFHLEHATLRPSHPACNLNPTSVAPSSIYIEKGTFEGKTKRAKKAAPKWDSGMPSENQ
jgi:hypothetical protein